MSSAPRNKAAGAVRWRQRAMQRLQDLRRAASFRMALLFFGLYGIISMALFVFLYLQISDYGLARIDDWLVREQNGMLRRGETDLDERVDYHANLDPDNQRPFALFARDGRRLAGAYPGARPAVPQPRVPFTLAAQIAGQQRQLRAIAHTLPDGRVLMLSQDLNEFHEFDEVLLRALVAAAALALLLGLAGAAMIGASSVRRLHAITEAIQSIVSGELGRRLPVRRRRNDDDLDRLVTVVNGMLDDLERLMHEVKGVCDSIAHDLRTPLARLLGGLERAQRRAGSVADYHSAVQEAILETHALLATFSAMLRISEVEDGMRRGGFVQLDLLAIADDVVDFYEPSAEDQGIVLRYERAAAGALPVRGDPSLLFEALSNLLDNAIKFTPRGGRVHVSVERDGACAVLRFADSGPGIPAAEREAVFRRFHRAESSRSTPGNGLGLSLVAAVARIHDMTVSIDECVSGCQISLRLPLAP